MEPYNTGAVKRCEHVDPGRNRTRTDVDERGWPQCAAHTSERVAPVPSIRDSRVYGSVGALRPVPPTRGTLAGSPKTPPASDATPTTDVIGSCLRRHTVAGWAERLWGGPEACASREHAHDDEAPLDTRYWSVMAR